MPAPASSRRDDLDAPLPEGVFEPGSIDLLGIDQGRDPPLTEADRRGLDAFEEADGLVRRQGAALTVQAGDPDLDPPEPLPGDGAERLDPEGVARGRAEQLVEPLHDL